MENITEEVDEETVVPHQWGLLPHSPTLETAEVPEPLGPCPADYSRWPTAHVTFDYFDSQLDTT